VVHKDYVLDYTSALRNVIMEHEHEAGILSYRYVYGLEKTHVVIYGIGNGSSSNFQPFSSSTDAALVDYEVNGDGELEYVSETGFYLSDIMETYDYGSSGLFMPFSSGTNIVKLYYHSNRLGSIDYITDNVSGNVMGYITYDDWGALTSKQVLRTNQRELDLV